MGLCALADQSSNKSLNASWCLVHWNSTTQGIFLQWNQYCVFLMWAWSLQVLLSCHWIYTGMFGVVVEVWLCDCVLFCSHLHRDSCHADCTKELQILKKKKHSVNVFSPTLSKPQRTKEGKEKIVFKWPHWFFFFRGAKYFYKRQKQGEEKKCNYSWKVFGMMRGAMPAEMF